MNVLTKAYRQVEANSKGKSKNIKRIKKTNSHLEFQKKLK